MVSNKRKEHFTEDDTDSSKRSKVAQSPLKASKNIVSNQNNLPATSDHQHDSDASVGPDHHAPSILKRQSDEFSLKDPFWLYLFITSALKRSTQFLQNHEVNTMEVGAAETAPFDQAIKECARMFSIDPSMTTSEEDSRLTEMTEIDTTTHYTGVIVLSEAIVYHFERPQNLLDNTSYQQDNHVEACQKLGIEDPENPRVLGMQKTERLKFWQPVAIWRTAEIRSNPNIKGAILADGFGLGKTWIITGYLLHVSLPKRHLQKAVNSILMLTTPSFSTSMKIRCKWPSKTDRPFHRASQF